MTKRNYGKRIAAGILAALVAMSSAFSGLGSSMTVEAASSWQQQNLLVNPDFEEARDFSPAGNSHLGNWFSWQSSGKTTASAQSGTTAAIIYGTDSSLEQDVTGLNVGSTYVYSVWAKVSAGGATSEHVVGVKNYGGEEIKQQVTSTEWTKIELEFVYTSGNPRVFGWINQHQGVDLYLDNASVTAKSDVQRVDIANGEITVAMSGSFEGSVSVEDFSANYYLGNDSETAAALTLKAGSWNAQNKTFTMNFDEIEKLPGTEQTVTVNLIYGEESPIQLDFTVEAGAGEVVVANLVSVNADNGSLVIVLDEAPTITPKEADFAWEYKVGNGSFKALTVENFAYDSEQKSVTVDFTEIRVKEAQTVKVKVTYNGISKEDAFEAAISEANTYYVDSKNGNDSNDGLAPETAIASIDKLNRITFLPGDEILFKKGETFVGCFKPQGSGTETAPITIGSYGDGDERPVLQPGEDWQVSHIMSADAMHPGVGGTTTSPYVNYVIQFYNVEYWEVSDLEIYDPTPQTRNDFTATYCSGITIQGEDIGVLEHFYIDNVIIHGFHGPGTNLGKTSGGITMNVITNKEWERSRAVPTQINDIRITNCEIYDVGRSGINFLTPWARRTEGKWANRAYGTGRAGFEWLPYEDFYLANNYIHDIDGDGCIVDNCANAVVENNLVTQCVTHLHSSAKMAVGLFNWNSDDTYFQFNEVYDIQIGGTEAYNDGQGIEIDALNDRTWVQYNYVHDNRGGFMMFCTIGDSIRGYDYVVRYNISQNDYAHPRQGIFDVYADSHNGKIYNNTIYLTERALKNDQIFLFATAQSAGPNDLKMYNNIFYYDGETPKAANQFGNNALDWQSNIFYGFTNLPEDDNPSAPNLNVDPMLANPGAGGTGSWNNGVIEKVDLSCYKLLENSPAINVGVYVEDNGGRDYFGNKVSGIPDIGAYESGSVVLKLMSSNEEVVINQETDEITIAENAKISVKDLLESLICEDAITVTVKRGNTEITDGIRLAEGDVVTAQYNGENISYTVKVVKGAEESNVIPPEQTIATAGSAETEQSNDAPSNVLDGSVGTIWHTAWNGAAAADRYLTLEIKDGYEYEIFGYEYTPRTGSSDGAVNGIVTGYEIYVSDDNTTWKKVANGTWAQNSDVKTVTFTPVKAKYVKLLAVTSVGNFASAAEARLIGNIYDAEAPTVPVVSVSDVTKTSVVVNWTEATDNYEVVDYVLLVNGEEKAVFDSDTLNYKVENLSPNAEYTFAVCAVDAAGNRSEVSAVSAKTKTDKVFVDVAEDAWYADEIQYVYDKGIMTGISDTMFEPETAVTRATIVQTLYKLEGKPAVSDFTKYDSLNDTLESIWWKNGLAWALNEGVAKGDSHNNVFNPDNEVTREDLATFIYRYAQYKGVNVELEGTVDGVLGDTFVNNWAKTAFAWAIETGLIKGKTIGGVADLAPQVGATRAELATIMMRFYEKYNF